MKKVIRGKELRDKMEEAIALLCGTVKQTLGPMGRNVIIDHSSFNPFITNDGVTIAKNIESDDEGVGAILEIAKEASIKTDENVGDGTTTTLVILEALINLSQNYIDEGNQEKIRKALAEGKTIYSDWVSFEESDYDLADMFVSLWESLAEADGENFETIDGSLDY